jgi:hypothetical protein
MKLAIAARRSHDDRASTSNRRLRLLLTAGGWSLTDVHGKLLFSGTGDQGRRRCLEFARTYGALTVST